LLNDGQVNGFFALATEALDDDGCPHTLEHLVFLGSEKYPYKVMACFPCCLPPSTRKTDAHVFFNKMQGVLDRVANRALAQGTNAW